MTLKQPSVTKNDNNMTRNDNEIDSGCVIPIPTSPHLFKTILISVSFKKLNGVV